MANSPTQVRNLAVAFKGEEFRRFMGSLFADAVIEALTDYASLLEDVADMKEQSDE